MVQMSALTTLISSPHNKTFIFLFNKHHGLRVGFAYHVNL